MENFYASRVGSDSNFLCHNKFQQVRTEFCGNKLFIFIMCLMIVLEAMNIFLTKNAVEQTQLVI